MVKARAVQHQVGGHEGAFMEMEPGVIRKKVSEKEHGFYLAMLPGGPHAAFAAHAPELRGTSSNAVGDRFVHMEDLTAGMHWPSILDVKLGTQSYFDGEGDVKKQKMRKKDRESTTHSMGMRITGMRAHNVFDHTQNIKGKVWGRQVTPETTQSALELYFSDGSGNLRRKEAEFFAEQIEMVEKFMASQTDVRVYSSSLLFVFDACLCSVVEPRMRMIDFAHVHPAPKAEADAGYLLGARNLRRFMAAIAADSTVAVEDVEIKKE